MRTSADRLMARISKDPATECWNWTGCHNKNNHYGQIGAYQKIWYTHRLAYHLFVGPIPEGKSVLHSCDNRSCCNPEHLYAGTQKDNVADAVKRNRHLRGEACPFTKISDATVLAILDEKAKGTKQIDLAHTYGVSEALISTIVHHRTRKHLFVPLP